MHSEAEAESYFGAQVEFPLSCRTSPPQGGRLDAATASANLERQRRLRARQTVAFGFLVFLTGAGGAALRPRPIAFANCEREAA
ncbi:MAG: hypothetical protein E5Y61_13465 [Mesorhizobium sp.]|nr:MAG: hypothetical protein E5Y61_13465 [Mesorhizobium sp.]TIM66847.1 MAG: hypothetical protein E5Y60_19060 [Mesorhizobium sp.]